MSRYRDCCDAIDLLRKDPDYGFYVNQWIDYRANNWNRVKLLHDIRLSDGQELGRYYPNGNSWSNFGGTPGPARVNDKDVTHIRLSAQQMGERNTPPDGAKGDATLKLPDHGTATCIDPEDTNS